MRSIERDGTINTIAGGGTSAPADGLLATSAALSSPTGMVIDPSGSVIVAVTGSNQLWTLRPARASSYAPWLHSAAPASVAQLVEHFTRNEGVSGSSPLEALRKTRA